MSTAFNELLPDWRDEKPQLWLIGTREQVNHLINECYVRQLTDDRAKFTPIVPFPFIRGRFISILEREVP